MKTRLNTILAYSILLLLILPMYQCNKASSGSNSGSQTNTTITPPVTQPVFMHPGILNTQASLDLVASQANTGDATRLAAYQKILDFISGRTYPTSFPATVVVGSNGASSPSKDQIRSDAELVYAIALCWARTGDQQYATQAIGILNGWATNFKNYALLDANTNASQPDLEASWTTPSFVAAAEIMRYYKVNNKLAGWADADITKFNAYLNTVNTNYISKTPQYTNNWNASAGYAQMAIGIFLENKTIYQSGYNTMLNNFNGIIQADGTLPELCDRQDCVHYQYSLSAYTFAAQLARIQGDNGLYTTNANRISAGYDYMKKAYAQTTGCNYCTTASQIFPGAEVAYNYYKTTNLQYLRGLGAPLGVTSDKTFLGFTTYTHYNVSVL
jgi:hypothetical protein